MPNPKNRAAPQMVLSNMAQPLGCPAWLWPPPRHAELPLRGLWVKGFAVRTPMGTWLKVTVEHLPQRSAHGHRES